VSGQNTSLPCVFSTIILVAWLKNGKIYRKISYCFEKRYFLPYFFRSGQKEMCLFKKKMRSSTWAWLNSLNMCIVFKFLLWERLLWMNKNERFFKAITWIWHIYRDGEWGQPITPPCFNGLSRRLSQVGTIWDATLAKLPFISSFLSQIVISK